MGGGKTQTISEKSHIRKKKRKTKWKNPKNNTKGKET